MSCCLCMKIARKFHFLLTEESRKLKMIDIIKRHFKFLGEKLSDETKNWKICNNCWENTSSFHKFYLEILKMNKVSENEPVEELLEVKIEMEDFKLESDIDFDIFEEPIKSETELDDPLESDITNYKEEIEEMESEDNDFEPQKKKPRKNRKKTATKKMKTGQFEDDEKLLIQHCKMTCEMCDFEFKCYMDAKNHYREIHNTRGFLKCCNKRFYKKLFIIDHIKLHLNPESFYCAVCFKTFPNRKLLRAHENRHKCPVCEKSFKTPTELKEHVESHGGDQILYECNICSKTFHSNVNMLNHRRRMHPAESKKNN